MSTLHRCWQSVSVDKYSQCAVEEPLPDIEPCRLVRATVNPEVLDKPAVVGRMFALREVVLDMLSSGPLQDMGVNLFQGCSEYGLRTY